MFERASAFLGARSLARAAAVLAGLLLAMDAHAAAPERPSFTSLRQDEDWSALCDPALRTGVLDALKCILLTADRSAWPSLGGEVRKRYEYTHDPLWGEDPQDDNEPGMFDDGTNGSRALWGGYATGLPVSLPFGTSLDLYYLGFLAQLRGTTHVPACLGRLSAKPAKTMVTGCRAALQCPCLVLPGIGTSLFSGGSDARGIKPLEDDPAMVGRAITRSPAAGVGSPRPYGLLAKRGQRRCHRTGT